MNPTINKIPLPGHAELVSAPCVLCSCRTGAVPDQTEKRRPHAVPLLRGVQGCVTMPGRTLLSLLPLLLLPLLLLLNTAASAQQGFVQTDAILQSGALNDGQVTQLNYTGKQTTRTYVDGLGRPIQTVAVQASPAHNDLIQPAAYDALGRQTTGYLPYAGVSTDITGSYRPNAISTDQPNYYNQTGQHVIPVDADPFGAQVFDNSPLQRVLKAGSIGSGFQPASGQYYKTITYRYNTSTDAVWIWTTAAVHTGGNNYAANTLSVTDGTDEDGVETQVFTDMAGRTVLKRQILSPANLDTYYIYNNSGMLINIIPPKATAIMTAGSNYSLTQTGIPALLFTYAYDSHGRVTKKTVPGSITIIYIYDPLNRPVLVQDANMAVNNQWTYIKYDVKGRAISQGIYTDGANIGQTAMQGYVNGLSSSYATAWYESRSNTQTNLGYYTNNIFPNTNITAMAYEYYDNYTLNSTTTYSYHTVGLTGEVGATTAQVKGMPTMVQKCTVGSGLTTTWLISVTFYDHNLHAIQTQSNNILYTTLGNTTPTDYKTIVPDFIGMPKISYITKKSTASITASVKTTPTYDHMHRVTAVDQSYNGLSAVHVAQYAYNELGQVMQKKLGGTGTGWLQLVDFRYNIRGQLTSINNSTLTNDSGTTDDDTDPVFGMTLLYDQQDGSLGNTAYHSGRLSAVKWMSKDGSDASSKERAFTYSYDAVDRYTGATYAERSGSGAFNVNHGWDEQITGYDENGNIKGITRNMEDPSTGTVTAIDNLSYAYSGTNANSLQQVTDGTGSNYSNNGFRNYMNNTSTNYSYDANGNLTNDPYKGISFNAYNVLNKPDKMTLTYNVTGSRYIEYIYDASGTILRKIAYDNAAGTTTTDYLDGFVYINGALSYVSTPEGRALYSGGAFANEYTITDQQGNARVSFNNTGTGGARKVVQENSYYGFGMVMPNSPVTGGDNKLLYNGRSEWQNDFQNQPDYYQTFYRNYDASIGRFVSTDPKSESAASMTNYQYAGDMPVIYNDPMGDLLDFSRQNKPAPLNGSGGFAGLMAEVAEADASEAYIQSINDATSWVSLGGTNIYHAGDGTSLDPSTGMSPGQLEKILKSNEIVIGERGLTYWTNYTYLGPPSAPAQKAQYPLYGNCDVPMEAYIGSKKNFISWDNFGGLLADYVYKVTGGNVSDVVGISIQGNIVDEVGGGLNVSAFLITRGKKRGFYVTGTPSVRVGEENDIIVSAFFGDYQREGDPDPNGMIGLGVDFPIDGETTRSGWIAFELGPHNLVLNQVFRGFSISTPAIGTSAGLGYSFGIYPSNYGK